MLRIAKRVLLGLLLSGIIPAGASNFDFKVYDIDVKVNETARTIDLALDLRMENFNLSRHAEAVYTPVVISEDGKETFELPSFMVCGRNRYYWYVREGAFRTGNTKIFRSGGKDHVEIRESVPLQDWMLHNATVEIRQEAATCCATPAPVPGNSPWGNILVARLHSPDVAQDYDYVFAPPMASEPVKKSLEGKAFVTFVVNRTELKPEYMNNRTEIKKITNSIDVVKADPDAIITEVHIRGYASPEGSYENNVRLAKGRTETLAGYVGGLYKFEPGIMTTSYDPEDWTGLRSYVADSLRLGLANRQELLDIIDGPLGLDEKDAALRNKYPADYDVLLRQVYPWLRHSDYTVKYNIKVYTEPADLMRLYNTDATKLRSVDFYTIAQQYAVGSADYIAVMRKAVEVYPDDPMLNLNMANICLMEGNFDAAQSCLLKAGRTPQADYARGVMAAKRGDYKSAENWFGLARDGGVEQADLCLKQVERNRQTGSVEILIPTTK